MRSSIHTSLFSSLLALSIITGIHAFSMVDHTLFHSQPTSLLSTTTTTTTAIYSSASPSENGDDNNSNKTPLQIAEENQQQDVLEFFLPAVNYQDYIVSGTVGQGTFLCQREGGPKLEELSNEQMLKIVQLECTDLEVNTLVWKCLGYRFDNGVWTDAEVFPNWKQNYPPPPPDFINMQRVYSKQVDEPCLRVNQALVRSIPLDLKQQLKPALKPLGWTGYTMVGLTPNKTRRAQCANWLLFYRDHLFGKTIDQLREERRVKQEADAKAKEGREEEEEEFRPPVKEVF